MKFAFNFNLEKMIFLKQHNNSIKVGLFCLYFGTKKMTFFCFIIWDGGSRPYYIVGSYEIKVPLFESLLKLSFMNFNTLVLFLLPPICSSL